MTYLVGALGYGPHSAWAYRQIPTYSNAGHIVKPCVVPGLGRYGLVLVYPRNGRPMAATLIRIPYFFDKLSIGVLAKRDLYKWFKTRQGIEALSIYDDDERKALLDYTSTSGNITMSGQIGLFLEYAIRLFVLAVLLAACYFAYQSHGQLAVAQASLTAVQSQVTALEVANKALAGQVKVLHDPVMETKAKVTNIDLLANAQTIVQATQLASLVVMFKELASTHIAVGNVDTEVKKVQTLAGTLATSTAVTAMGNELKAKHDAVLTQQKLIEQNQAVMIEAEKTKLNQQRIFIQGIPKLMKVQLETIEKQIQELKDKKKG